MRILAVTPYFTPEGGGLERYAHTILRRLGGRGHEVHVLAATRGTDGEVHDGPLTVMRTRAPVVVGNTPIDPRLRRRVRAEIRTFTPDVVVAHTPVPYAAEMAWLAARRAGIPFVTTYHGGRLRGGSRLLDGVAALDRITLERLMLGGSRALIAVSPYVRDHALARHRDRVHIVPPGVDPQRFRPAPPSGDEIVLFVGPLSRQYRWKGIDVLREAFRRVRRVRPQARLHIVGDGDRAAALRQREAAPDSAIRFLGRLDDEALVQAYQSAAVVALPSTTDAESFGMVLAEANACGRPVVASRIGGIPDFVRHGDNGLLATPGDAHDLAERLLTLLADPEAAAAMGRRGAERVRREHDWDELTTRTERVLLAVSERTIDMPAPLARSATAS